MLKLPSLTFTHREPDEQVYWTLAGRLLHDGQYNLHGTEILGHLSPWLYDRPIFLHPPLFPTLLIPFVYFDAQHAAIVIPWLGHLLCVLAVALIGRRMVEAGDFDINDCQLLFWLPVIGMALDPFLIFVSLKLWIDGLLAGLCAITLTAFFGSRYAANRKMYLITGGVLFGLAGLAKITALTITPVVLLLILTPKIRSGSRARDMAWGILPAAALLVPWFGWFHHETGVFLPTWTKPDQWTIDNYPFIAHTLQLRPAYYILKMAAIQPVIALCAIFYLGKWRWWRSLSFAWPWLWFAAIFFPLWLMGLQGQGFQMRFLAPLFPAIYLMVYPMLNGKRQRVNWMSILILLCFIYAGINGLIYLWMPQYVEINPAFVFLYGPR